MTIVFNGIIVLLVLLIAYWWANQGLFSAVLHLICVIAAGAVALAFYEVLTVGLLLRGNRFDDYAWGIALVGLFVVSLLIFRVITDKVVYANLNFPQWANFAFGLPVGACSGVIALGFFLIGGGMVQSHKEIMGWEGYGRSHRTGRVENLGPTLWVPVHLWTNEFYNYLSVGSLYPAFNDTPLARHNPELYRQASLMRDSFNAGRGKLSLPPDAVQIQSVKRDPETNRHRVEVSFGPLARDFGEQLTLSASQIRLITVRSNDPTERPTVVHPDTWFQRTPQSPLVPVQLRFDSSSNYVSSLPGGERTPAAFEFSVPANHRAEFIQIRGTRFRLPRATDAAAGEVSVQFDDLIVQLSSGPNIQEHVRVDNGLSPLMLSKNAPRGSLTLQDDYLDRGENRFIGRGERPPRALAVRGIYEHPGTKVVQVYIRPGDPHNMSQPEVRRAIGDNARIVLVDEQGRAYSPIGFIHEGRQGIHIKLEPQRFLPHVEDFPALPQGANETLRIVFRITQNVTIKGLMAGDITLGNCDVPITR